MMGTSCGGVKETYDKALNWLGEQAIDRMLAEARAKGANAIVGFRFATCEVSRAAAEVVAYGTAVRVEPNA